MFEEELIILIKKSQVGPSGVVYVWVEGDALKFPVQLSNSMQTLTANAQGVKANGYITPPEAIVKKYDIKNDTWFKYPKGNCYIHTLDNGVVESGSGVFNVRQFSVESSVNKPK